MRAKVLCFALLGAAGIGQASAAPAKPAPEPLAPALPAPALAFKVAPASSGPWRMSIENTGDVPIRIPADARLLVLDLAPPAAAPEPKEPKKKAPAGPIRCTLPDDARPSSDEGHELVLPPHRSWSSTFDPLFYCFSAKERAALVAGTSVKAWFGWPARLTATGPKATRAATAAPPFAAAPVGAAVGRVSSVKALEADAVALTDAVVVAPSKSGEDTKPVTLSLPEAMDALRGAELLTTVSLHNGSDRPLTLLYRPEMILFTVNGPLGPVSCGFPRQVHAPIRELFATIGVKGRTDTTVLFTTTCPAGTFDEPGIYRLSARLDTTQASGRPINLKSWDDIAESRAPLLLRVRTPRRPQPAIRPTLD